MGMERHWSSRYSTQLPVWGWVRRIGYSEKQDRVIQYPLELSVIENGKRSMSTNLWPDYLMKKDPVKPGFWKYEIDYRGRGGSLDKWEVRYNAAKERLEGTLTVVTDEP
jgi:hypothetical protein